MLRRNEWSRPVETPEPSLPVASDKTVRDAVGPLSPAELAPAFTTDVVRRTAVVEVAVPDRGRALVELALDSGEIRARNRRETVSELELELVEGPASALYELAMTMQASAPLRDSDGEQGRSAATSSPAGRAMAATRRRPSRSPRASRWTRRLQRSFVSVRISARRTTMRCWPAPIPKACTSFAWRCRRMRSALVVFRTVLPQGDAAWLKREASRLIDLLGPARDWDVFIAETLAAVRTARPDDETLESLGAAAEEERARAYEKAEALRAPAHTAFLLRFGRWIETAGWRAHADRAALDRPLAGLAAPLLDKRHKRVLKRGRDFEQLSDARLHQLRITLKKLRYAGEFFAAQFPDGKPRPYIRALRRLQDDLGGLNDAAVAEQCLRELVHARRGNSDLAALGVGAGQVIGWHVRASAEARPRIDEDWHAFAAAAPYWRPGGGSMA